jgi:hypothetical protein
MKNNENSILGIPPIGGTYNKKGYITKSYNFSTNITGVLLV